MALEGLTCLDSNNEYVFEVSLAKVIRTITHIVEPAKMLKFLTDFKRINFYPSRNYVDDP